MCTSLCCVRPLGRSASRKKTDTWSYMCNPIKGMGEGVSNSDLGLSVGGASWDDCSGPCGQCRTGSALCPLITPFPCALAVCHPSAPPPLHALAAYHPPAPHTPRYGSALMTWYFVGNKCFMLRPGRATYLCAFTICFCYFYNRGLKIKSLSLSLSHSKTKCVCR